MRRAAKTDASQAVIVDALRAAGAWVRYLREPFDLLVGYRGRWFVMECKLPLGPKGGDRSRLTPAQERDLEEIGTRARVWIVRTPEDALEALRS